MHEEGQHGKMDFITQLDIELFMLLKSVWDNVSFKGTQADLIWSWDILRFMSSRYCLSWAPCYFLTWAPDIALVELQILPQLRSKYCLIWAPDIAIAELQILP